MCGIAGFLEGAAGRGVDERRRIADAMIGRIRHRGPDGRRTWTPMDGAGGADGTDGLCLAHARLSIVDLAPSGDQPMRDASGRWTIAYNGELYNHRALRASLERDGAIAWRGRSDTEVLIEHIARRGLAATLEAAVGMFAFALWDGAERSLVLVRDRFGEKPLYAQPLPDGVVFASELAALEAHPRASRRVDEAAVAALLAEGAIPAPRSILDGVFKLEPGTLWRIGVEGRIVRELWYDLAGVAADGLAHPFTGDDDAAVERFETLFERAVADQMVADVPLGAFLSGGIDSSLVVATMQRLGAAPVRTFSIGFDAAGYDESGHARAVADALGTEHRELRVGPAEVLDTIAALPAAWSEPFADSSQVPTAIVAALAREDVTVALSGDGGDEVFCGYERHAFALRQWPILARVPGPVRSLAGGALGRVPPQALDALAARTPGLSRWSRPGEKLHRGAALLGAPDLPALYRGLTRLWRDPTDALAAGAVPTGTPLPEFLRHSPHRVPDGLDPAQWMMLADQRGYLPTDILAKVDRAAMAVSLETRVPFLDHRLVAFAWSLPRHLRVRDGRAKWLPREALRRRLPAALVERPKMGFSIPLHELLRGPLVPWAEALLDPDRLARDGRFDVIAVRRAWSEHRRGTADHAWRLWAVLMFEAWRERRG